jgi:hypothetical protein
VLNELLSIIRGGKWCPVLVTVFFQTVGEWRMA